MKVLGHCSTIFNYSLRLLLVVCRTSLCSFVLPIQAVWCCVKPGGHLQVNSSQGVDTQELAIVLFGLTFIKVCNERQANENQSRIIWLCFLLMKPQRGVHVLPGVFCLDFCWKLYRFPYAQGKEFPLFTYLSSINTMSY